MATVSVTLDRPNYSEEDHWTWSALWKRQLPLAQEYACDIFLEGLERLDLDQTRLPDPQEISDRIFKMTGWTLCDAQNAYLGPREWFEHIAERRFPVTNYIRKPHEIEFTPLPDLFHEYFGHLAYFTNPEFADIAQLFGPLYLSAPEERQQLDIARLWWHTTEFGLIRQNGELKIFGAGLLSSPGEMQHSLQPDMPRIDLKADLRYAAAAPSAAYSYHERYFIIDSLDYIRQMVFDYAKLEGLPEPKI